MALDPKVITVRGSEFGAPHEVIVTRSFPIGKHLSSGEQDPQETSHANYRLTDLRVGDKVFIRLHAIRKEDVCVTVTILRRPGGVVPRAPWDKRTGNRRMYHETMNAYQAHEEKGVPLPPDLDPATIRAKMDWEFQQHEKRIKEILRRFHTAPPPREVKR